MDCYEGFMREFWQGMFNKRNEIFSGGKWGGKTERRGGGSLSMAHNI